MSGRRTSVCGSIGSAMSTSALTAAGVSFDMAAGAGVESPSVLMLGNAVRVGSAIVCILSGPGRRDTGYCNSTSRYWSRSLNKN